MGKFAYAFVGLTVLALLLSFWARMMVKKIPPNKVGVRTQNFAIFGEKGVFKKDYDKPGWYRQLPVIDTWNLFDKTVQTTDMGHGWKGAEVLNVNSADGYRVSIDLTVKYRIKPGEAHLMFQKLGSGSQYKQKVNNETQDKCRVVFGTINTEDFYNPEIRSKKTKEVLAKLREVMKDRHIEIIDLLIRDVKFDEQYERKIKQKKLADQEVELNRSKARAAEFKGITQKINAEIEAKVKIIDQEKTLALANAKAKNDLEIEKLRADYRRYVTEKKADADVKAAKLQAQGTLLIDQAKAEGEKMRNEALSGDGGKVLVALEAARNLQIRSSIFSTTNSNPLDLHQVADKFGLKK